MYNRDEEWQSTKTPSDVFGDYVKVEQDRSDQEIVLAYIQFFQYTVDQVKSLLGAQFDIDNILFVMTVPAAADILSLNITREAAEAAGLKHIVLMSEPMAALVEILDDDAESAQTLQPNTSTNVLVIDVGGGTSDVGANNIKKGESIEQWKATEIGQSLDRFGAGDEVDDNFERYMVERTSGAWETHQVKHPQVHLGVEFDLPLSSHTVMKDADAWEEFMMDQGGVDPENLIFIPTHHMEKLFDGVTDPILREVQRFSDNLEKNGNAIDLVFLVGGFATASSWCERVKAIFPPTDAYPQRVLKPRRTPVDTCVGKHNKPKAFLHFRNFMFSHISLAKNPRARPEDLGPIHAIMTRLQPNNPLPPFKTINGQPYRLSFTPLTPAVTTVESGRDYVAKRRIEPTNKGDRGVQVWVLATSESVTKEMALWSLDLTLCGNPVLYGIDFAPPPANNGNVATGQAGARCARSRWNKYFGNRYVLGNVTV
ncbi:hypothetical protein HK097_001764 [Rhizophlyctis rosea]|uniref:Actin-like ATPase domain-containing protein n=1 Tax=Rhizophlyctis rosea TaxID=64517 RepID=A0AAD5S459_9FUNG|nr:hypothetical protein HK097_001764 [Rhizophlyctis rosea]